MEFHVKHEITEMWNFILIKELLTCGNTEMLFILTKEARKLQKC